MYVLSIFEDNWADEMDLYGFSLHSEEDWNEITQVVEDYFKAAEEGKVPPNLEIYFGTNESNEYSSAKEVLKCVTTKKISKDDHDSIVTAFGLHKNSYDFGISIMWIVSQMSDRLREYK